MPERECYWHAKRYEADESSEAIINRNLSKLLIELDFSDLESIGTNVVWDNGAIAGKQDMLAAKMIINWKTGEITDIGNEKYINPDAIYSEYALAFDLRVLMNYPELQVEGQPKFFFELMDFESPSSNSRIPLTACLSEVAAVRIEETMTRAADPEFR